jgi:hypothetical protein
MDAGFDGLAATRKRESHGKVEIDGRLGPALAV